MGKGKLSWIERQKLKGRVIKEAIKEIKNNDPQTLMAKYTRRGKCRFCHKPKLLIKTTNLCPSCTFGKGRKLNDLRKKLVPGKCVCCGVKGLVDPRFKECIDCYLMNGRGGLK